jgi:prepilin-type N-terminal cleavage/methylation domain-containing protein
MPKLGTVTSPLALRVSRRAARDGGYTLLELITCLATMGILVAIAAPSLGPISAAFKVDNGSRTIAMALAQARVAAITRGHQIDVSFTSQGFTMTDPVVGGGYVVIKGDLPAPTTLTASGTTSFTPLGTVTAPLAVTVHSVGRQRVVRLGLAGEVEIE